MRSGRVFVLAVAGLSMGACSSVLPRPDYTAIQPLLAYRVAADGTRVDNEDYYLDAQGYRLGKNGQRIGEVDMPSGESSNAVAGYYISRVGAQAPGRVAKPSEGATAGAGYGPGSANPVPLNPR